MAERKTQLNDTDVDQFIDSVVEKRQGDCRTLLALMGEVTNAPARMWGKAIVGFGSYDYEYADGKPASFFRAGFSPRKQNLTLYVMGGFEPHRAELEKLGKHKTGKACLYVNKLDDIDLKVLKRILKKSVKTLGNEKRKQMKNAKN